MNAQTQNVLLGQRAIVLGLNLAENNLAALCKGKYLDPVIEKSVRKDLKKITKAREIAENMFLFD